MAKNALGRGLSSLLGGSYVEQDGNAQTESRTLVNQQSQQATPVKQQPVTTNRITVEGPDGITRRQTTKPAEQVSTSEIAEVAAQIQDNVVAKAPTIVPPNEIPYEKLVVNPYQPRFNFKKEELEELAASIKKDGVLEPIVVRAVEGDKYQIIMGERRWRACGIAGLKTVPIRVIQADDDKMLELAVIENVQRSDLNPLEEALAYRGLMEKKNLTQSEVAKLVSKGRSTVANALRLLDLPEAAQKLLYEEKITAGHARAILSIPTAEGRQKLTDKIINDKLSVREAEQYASLYRANATSKTSPTRQVTPKSYKKVARTLRDKLGTGVKIKTSQGRNRIEIEFIDEDDLQRVFSAMFEKEQQD